MANILRNIDKIRTTAGTEVDLDNIQATGGSSGGAAGLEGSGITYSQSGGDELYTAGNSSEIIALNISNPQDGDALVYDAASQTWTNKEVVSGPEASGGEVVTDTNYRTHTFNESGVFTVNTASLNIEYILVAGGGGGGSSDYNGGAGGGAGGAIVGTATLTRGDYTATIGAGATSNNSKGHNGSDSVFNSMTAIGGGGGGGHPNHDNTGADGGSGGGGTQANGYGGYGTAGQGNAGAMTPGYGQQGGGGGAGAAASSWHGADGIEWPTGSGNYYAGGGGSQERSAFSNPATTGGLGGGGAGLNESASNSANIHGVANTGGGGGGGQGAGGSGVLIIRYAI